MNLSIFRHVCCVAAVGGGVGMNGWMDGWVDTTTGSRFVCKDGGIAAMWNGATDRVGEIGRRCLGAL